MHASPRPAPKQRDLPGIATVIAVRAEYFPDKRKSLDSAVGASEADSCLFRSLSGPPSRLTTLALIDVRGKPQAHSIDEAARRIIVLQMRLRCDSVVRGRNGVWNKNGASFYFCTGLTDYGL